MMKYIAQIFFIFSIAFILISLSGCEKKYQYVSIDTNATFNNKQENLIEAFSEYWEAKSKKDFSLSYKYELPYQRYLHSINWYQIFHSPNNQGFTVALVSLEKIDNELILVHAKATFNGFTTSFIDPWYYVNESWFHKFQESKLPSSKSLWD